MSDAFGDYEPEDAWQADDPIPLQIENLLKRLDLLEGRPDSARGRFGTILDLIAQRLRPWQDRYATLSDREKVRVDQLADDLDLLRDRDRAD